MLILFSTCECHLLDVGLLQIQWGVMGHYPAALVQKKQHHLTRLSTEVITKME